MDRYYSEKLAADKLRRAYDIAPPRIQQYLRAEIDFVLNHIHPDDIVLELGCGYGRVLEYLAAKAALTVGIDTSRQSLLLAQALIGRESGPRLSSCLEMDAAALAFKNDTFDAVVCIQNGISAFHIDQRRLLNEALRVTRSGGKALFSSYAERFWNDRLKWFELQAQEGLLGEIDYNATGNGVIVCKDGFRATTVTPRRFQELTADLAADVKLEEVDQSSLFCIITKK